MDLTGKNLSEILRGLYEKDKTDHRFIIVDEMTFIDEKKLDLSQWFANTCTINKGDSLPI